MTKAGRDYMGKVASLGCVICRILSFGKTPAEVHHARTGVGMGRRSSDFDTMPLCFFHHRGQGGIHSLGRKAFEREYGVTELNLVERTRDEVERMKGREL